MLKKIAYIREYIIFLIFSNKAFKTLIVDFVDSLDPLYGLSKTQFSRGTQDSWSCDIAFVI